MPCQPGTLPEVTQALGYHLNLFYHYLKFGDEETEAHSVKLTQLNAGSEPRQPRSSICGLHHHPVLSQVH